MPSFDNNFGQGMVVFTGDCELDVVDGYREWCAVWAEAVVIRVIGMSTCRVMALGSGVSEGDAWTSMLLWREGRAWAAWAGGKAWAAG